MKSTAVVLAAGHGIRMESSLPKVLHSLGGRPLLQYSLNAVRQATNTTPLVVVGSEAKEIRETAEQTGKDILVAIQQEQLGTGHALRQAESQLRGKNDLVIVTSADLPLITVESFRMLVEEQQSHTGPMTMLTVISDKPRGFGRIMRDADKQVIGIVEEAQATPEQLKINELNVGAYCFQARWLWDALPQLPLSPKGEYYITDLVAIAVEEGLEVNALTLDDTTEAIGINTRAHLAEAEAALRQRINHRWMLAGVTIRNPDTTYIDEDVTIGPDTTIMPNTMLQGTTSIGVNCTLGPNTIITDSQIGDECKILASVVEEAKLEDNVDVGPYCHLRKGAHLASGVHMGNFGEVKNSYLGPGVKMGHFSYLGDATIGKNVNIGAGTITANYDGVTKHHTEIEADAFIGSDTMLVAPLKIGKGARTGAGSVVTKDVPDQTVVVGIPARAIRKIQPSE